MAVGFPHPLTPFKIKGLGAVSPALTIGGISSTGPAVNLQTLKSGKATLYNLSVVNFSGADAFVQCFGFVGGAGATVTFTVTAGVITAVTAAPAAAGTNYPPSTTVYLPVTSGGGINGVVAATTDATGVVTAFALISGGTGYSNTTGASTGIALGTAIPDLQLYVPSTKQADAIMPQNYGIGFANGLSIASSTTAGGGTGSAAGIWATGNFA